MFLRVECRNGIALCERRPLHEVSAQAAAVTGRAPSRRPFLILIIFDWARVAISGRFEMKVACTSRGLQMPGMC